MPRPEPSSPPEQTPPTRDATSASIQTRDLVSDDDLPPAQRRDRANVLRQAGDDAYSQGNKERAEKLYLHATTLAPDSALAFLRLADLYVEMKQPGKARDILQQALQSQALDSETRKQITQKRDQIR